MNDPVALNVSYKAAENHDFDMLITAVQDISYKDPDHDLETIQSRVKAAGQSWLPRSVEDTVLLHHVDGPAVHGYYFSLTDKTTPLPAGEFKHITQGMALSGNLLIVFTISTNDGQAPMVEQGLGIIASARFRGLK